GTQPKLYYIDGDESAIVPTAARHESIYMWSQRNAALHGGGAVYPLDSPLLQENALAAYDVSHARPWGWQVPAYCWTKSIGSGALAVPAIAILLGRLSGDRISDIALAAVAGFSVATSILLWPTVLVGFCAAAYTAFLFGQCEGRDLWQTPLLPAHLIVQAVLCGSAVLALLPDSIGGSSQALSFAIPTLAITLGLHLLMLLGEIAMPHTTDNARYAARLMTHGPFAQAFWGGAVVVGGVIPMALLFLSFLFSSFARIAAGGASVLALVGLLIFEWCFVMAGQSVPNS